MKTSFALAIATLEINCRASSGIPDRRVLQPMTARSRPVEVPIGSLLSVMAYIMMVPSDRRLSVMLVGAAGTRLA
jgi:hypothetical protein